MHVKLQNEAGVVKEVKIGFSWTTFFFGFFPALFRGDLMWAVIMFVAALAIGALTLGFGGWIPGVVFSFVYNKIYIKELLKKGYAPTDESVQTELVNRGIIVKVPAAS
ncbi:hypothetical protein [Bacillus sp. FJAT-45037]|uniref:hypothetical protein n=1 Tax=Bacillus sp. FJAT-45037 TaxID=2011007 RepID=UPI000C23207B|nr:hypothetical protein [Bacillus sp. FJAT-45037]